MGVFFCSCCTCIVNSRGKQDGKFVSGNFYGPLAEELSGIYDQEEGKTAAIFGAKR